MRRRGQVGGRSVRGELLDHERELIARYPQWPTVVLDRLEAGQPVDVHGWEIGWPVVRARLHVEADDTVTVLESPSPGTPYRPAREQPATMPALRRPRPPNGGTP